MKTKETYKVLHLFCGLGGGALGFQKAVSTHKGLEGRFATLAGIDNDPEACTDFETLTGSRSVCADVSKMSLQEMRDTTCGIAPDVIFSSPPCKGFSGLLSKAKAKSKKYQSLNRLVLEGLTLCLEAWDRKPKLILLENVPLIQQRGKELLRHVRELLMRYGYVFHEGLHDCGELGGLSQHRRRYLMIARHEPSLPTFVHKPDKKPLRTIGQCLERLPMPDDPAAGPMHRLPRLEWKTLIRLALIPAGSDWRAIGTKDGSKRYNNVYRIVQWDDPSVAVTGGTGPSSGGVNVADPRIPTQPHHSIYKVVALDSDEDQHITADPHFGSDETNELDPRFDRPSRPNLYGVMRWNDPAKTVTGSAQVSGSNGAAAIADPRLPEKSDHPPIIISADDTWHRPLTTLELAALQGLPVRRMMTKPLSGKAHTRWRERIGNAVPPPTARIIAQSILKSLLSSEAGDTFVLSSSAIWVRRTHADALTTQQPIH